ncbi:MAG: tetratricopeptide repeat protein [Pirellulaceae bacterium]
MKLISAIRPSIFRRLVLLTAMFVVAGSQVAFAQQFRSRNQNSRQSTQQSQTRKSAPARQKASAARMQSVSPDLLKIYEQTKSATSEARVSSIVTACRAVVASRSRTVIDRDYARSLLAWALNRRGEMRSDEAAELVGSGDLERADQLDQLASEDFRAAIDYSPDNWRTRHNYAISLAMKSEYERAIKQLDRSIELNPDYANSYFNRGELYFELGQYNDAVADYDLAIEITPTDAQYYNSRAHSKFMDERHSSALEDYRTAAEMDPKSATLLTDYADALQYLGKWKQAAETYRSAVGEDSKYARAYQNAAWLMATCPEKDVRNPKLAVAAARKAIELSEREVRTLDTLAAAMAAAGDQIEAAELQREAVRLSGDPEERVELDQRLSLYLNGSVYRQPKPLSGEQDRYESDTNQASGSPIRTASSDEARARSRQ